MMMMMMMMMMTCDEIRSRLNKSFVFDFQCVHVNIHLLHKQGHSGGITGYISYIRAGADRAGLLSARGVCPTALAPGSR